MDKEITFYAISDGLVHPNQGVWWKSSYGPIYIKNILLETHLFNLRIHPNLYSIKKPKTS